MLVWLEALVEEARNIEHKADLAGLKICQVFDQIHETRKKNNLDENCRITRALQLTHAMDNHMHRCM